ncbi:MAG: hypothetical protein ABIX01_21490 [Chitinophagaceae bacterium]
MKPTLTLLLVTVAFQSFCQPADSGRISKATEMVPLISTRPEVLTGGFIDIVQTGQMNASARLFKLYVGEPGKFQVPVSLYSGVSANSFGNSKNNEDFVHHLINPSAGIFNLSFDGNIKLAGRKGRITCLQLQYMGSVRLLSGYDYTLSRNITLFNSNESLGLMFITGAWERNRVNNPGVFWVNIRGIYSISPTGQLAEIFGLSVKSIMLGYSLGMGIEISQAVNVRLLYYRYTAALELPSFLQPYFQVSFNYTMK